MDWQAVYVNALAIAAGRVETTRRVTGDEQYTQARDGAALLRLSDYIATRRTRREHMECSFYAPATGDPADRFLAEVWYGNEGELFTRLNRVVRVKNATTFSAPEGATRAETDRTIRELLKSIVAFTDANYFWLD